MVNSTARMYWHHELLRIDSGNTWASKRITGSPTPANTPIKNEKTSHVMNSGPAVIMPRITWRCRSRAVRVNSRFNTSPRWSDQHRNRTLPREGDGKERANLAAPRFLPYIVIGEGLP